MQDLGFPLEMTLKIGVFWNVTPCVSAGLFGVTSQTTVLFILYSFLHFAINIKTSLDFHVCEIRNSHDRNHKHCEILKRDEA